MRRGGFTLIELLAVVAIMGAMVAVAVVSLGSGRDSMRLKGAARDAMAMIRRARSLALVTQKPVLVTYSNGKTADGETMMQVTLKGERLFSSFRSKGPVTTLSGEQLESDASTDDGSGGETLEEILSPQGLAEDVGRGLKVKVLNENELLESSVQVKRSSISTFSTVDGVSRTYSAGTQEDENLKAESEKATDAPFSVVFAANGTVQRAHKIWIYPETKTPDRGLCLAIDRFGDVRCQGEEDEP